MKIIIFCVVSLLGISQYAFSALDPHTHHAANFTFVVESEKDGKEVQLVATFPSQDIFGFEHRPKTVQEKQAQRDGLKKLRAKLLGMFQFHSKLGCSGEISSLKVAYLTEKKKPKSKKHKHHHNHGHKSKKKIAEHSEVRCALIWQCQQAVHGSRLKLLVRSMYPVLKHLDLKVLSDHKAKIGKDTVIF